MLDPTKIGYLRTTPKSGALGVQATGPTKAMLNKLAKTGHVSLTDGRYRRTELGEDSLAAFDQSLTEADLATLRA